MGERKGHKKLTCYLSPAGLAALKRSAAQRELTFGQIIEAALERAQKAVADAEREERAGSRAGRYPRGWPLGAMWGIPPSKK